MTVFWLILGVLLWLVLVFELFFFSCVVGAPKGWLRYCWLRGHGLRGAAEREMARLRARYERTGRWT